MEYSSAFRSQRFIQAFIALFLMAVPFQWSSAQVSLKTGRTTLGSVIEQIKTQSEYQFFYDDKLAAVSVAGVDVDNVPIEQALDAVLKGTDVSYKVDDNFVYLSVSSQRAQEGTDQSSRERTITGVVSDEIGPLVGVNVVVVGTDAWSITDFNGNFSLKTTEAKPVLRFSCIGFATQEVTVTDNRPLNIVMSNDTEQLEEVVVTALGIKRATKALSYNVQEVKSDEITAVKDANFMNTLNGKVAGVQFNTSAAGVGGAVRVVMRGSKSIYKDNNALYVIDGVPMTNVSFGSSDDGLQGNYLGSDSVADINPDDIESISVLTGPSAAALYGSEAANGVILINTKKGAEGKTQITVSNSTTFSTPFVMPRFQNTYGNEAGSYQSWGSETSRRYNPSDFFNTGTNINNSVSFSTGTQRHQVYLSAATVNSTNILPNSGYNRYNFTMRDVSKFFKDRMTLDLSANYIIQNNKNMIASGEYFNPLPALYLFPRGEDFDNVRMYQIWDESRNLYTQNWTYGSGDLSFQNPYWIMYKMLNESKKRRYIFSASLSYDATKWLNITGRVKVDNSDMDITNKRYAGTDTNFAGEKGLYNIIKRDDMQVYADAIANIDLYLAKDWHLGANVGASIKDVQMDYMGWGGDLRYIPNFFSITNISTTSYREREDGSRVQSQSVFANVEVGWKNMIYLTVTGRNDWESPLAFSKYSSFFYPSVGISGIISDMLNFPNWFSFLKLRASYSVVGSSYAAYLTLPYYEYSAQNHTWDTNHRFPNDDLKPEETRSWEVGLDARFFEGKVHIDATVYLSDTFNQTFEATPASTSGYSSVLVQAGQVRNTGLELLVSYDNTWDGFSWNSSLTYTTNRNRIISLADGIISPIDGLPIDMPYLEKATLGSTGSPQVILYVGGTMGDLYINRELRTDGNGNIYVDPQTNQVELVSTERRYVGTLLPKGNLGWSNTFSYGGVSLTALFTARLGGSVVSNTEALLDYYGVSERSAEARAAGGVKINNGLVDAKNYYQTIGAGTGAGAYYIYSATNVRLQELSLSYSLPREWFKDKLGMTVSLVGRNLWMIYNKAPFDPELTISTTNTYLQGVDYFMMPSLRNLGFSVKFQF